MEEAGGFEPPNKGFAGGGYATMRMKRQTSRPESSASETTQPTPDAAVNYVVRVRFLGFLERLAGQRETLVEVDAQMTVLDLLTFLSRRYGPDFSTALFRAPGEVHTYLSIFLDEEEVCVSEPIRATQNTARKVELLILPIFEGGSQ